MADKLVVKNVILDTTANSGSGSFTALSWAIAQNCALVCLHENGWNSERFCRLTLVSR